DYSPFRLRGVADDLKLDRIRNPQELKNASMASATFTGNSNTTPTANSVFKGAFGYAFVHDSFSSSTQIIPYLSFSQSFTDTKLKPRSVDGTNNFAGGVQIAASFEDSQLPALSHAFSAQPQFLMNTADQSQIAGGRIIYTPTVSYGTDATP